MLFRYIAIVTLALICSAVPSSRAFAHDSHSSVTEIEWNSTTQRFEVAMRLRIADLEDAISLQLKRRFRLESDSRRDEHLQRYVQKHFEAKFSSHTDSRLHWLGCELELHDAWIYFEVESLVGAGQPAAAAEKKSSAANRVTRWHDLFNASATASVKTTTPLLETVSVRSRLLIEVQPEQINVVTLTRSHQSISATLSRDVTQISL